MPHRTRSALLLAAFLLTAAASTAHAKGGGWSGSQHESYAAAGSAIANPASKAMLNPQPLPPKTWGYGFNLFSNAAARRVSLNPQPLPP